MKILAIDQATRSGWAFGDEHSFERRTVQFGYFKTPKREVKGERYLIFGHSVIERIEFHKPDLIAFEAVYVRRPKEGRWVEGKFVPPEPEKIPYNPAVTEFSLKIAGILQFVAAAKQVPVEEYPPQSWRKTALGHGFPDEPKKAMVLRARQLGYEVEQHDEADAIGILMHALHGAPANARAQKDLLEMVAPL